MVLGKCLFALSASLRCFTLQGSLTFASAYVFMNPQRPHKQQMLMDQCLTVQIMRSLRALACEKVSSVYCEVDDDIQRFDGLIQQNEIDTKEYCERGLESYLSDERRSEVDNLRKTHKMLVINEYAQQAKLGISDPETIRDLSLSQSKQSSIKARKLALIDERDARANKDKVHMNVHMQHQEEKYFKIENARETYVRERLQLLHLLAEKEKTQRVDSVLAYLQRQEQEKQRLQRNYHLQQQEEAQRLLLAQHHQRVFQSMQMATAAYLSQNNR